MASSYHLVCDHPDSCVDLCDFDDGNVMHAIVVNGTLYNLDIHEPYMNLESNILYDKIIDKYVKSTLPISQPCPVFTLLVCSPISREHLMGGCSCFIFNNSYKLIW